MTAKIYRVAHLFVSSYEQLNIYPPIPPEEKRRALFAFHANKRRAAKKQRTPKWADMAAIRAIYEECAKVSLKTKIKHQVDHIIPLQGHSVCGLHCEANMQIIPASENAKKYNKYE